MLFGRDEKAPASDHPPLGGFIKNKPENGKPMRFARR
jgi:hypothetical protein